MIMAFNINLRATLTDPFNFPTQDEVNPGNIPLMIALRAAPGSTPTHALAALIDCCTAANTNAGADASDYRIVSHEFYKQNLVVPGESYLGFGYAIDWLQQPYFSIQGNSFPA